VTLVLLLDKFKSVILLPFKNCEFLKNWGDLLVDFIIEIALFIAFIHLLSKPECIRYLDKKTIDCVVRFFVIVPELSKQLGTFNDI